MNKYIGLLILLIAAAGETSAQNITLSDFRYSNHIMTDVYTRQSNTNSTVPHFSMLNSVSSNPGLGFLASALIPGLGQAANEQFWKTAGFAAIEVAAIYLAVDQRNRAKKGERQYIGYGNENWSVVKYAAWVHQYYHTVPGARSPGSPDVDIRSLLTPAGQAYFDQTGSFPSPAFDNSTDWSMINIEALRELERRSLYLTTGRPFSHDIQDYGSQQYYELMSKYFQFGPGWRDWTDMQHDIHGGKTGMPSMWLFHASVGERFNDQYRVSGNMVSVLIMNHLISAFDAYFVIKLRQHRLSGGMEMTSYGPQMKIGYTF